MEEGLLVPDIDDTHVSFAGLPGSEDGDPSPNPNREGQVRSSKGKHCGGRLSAQQYKWVRASAICAALLTTILLTIYVGGAGLAKYALAHAGMNITKMQIVSVTANSALAVVEGTLDNRFPMGATIDALDVALAYNGVVFGSMNMSSLCIAASAASTLGPMTVALTVSDLPTFNAYAGAMFTEDWVTVTATGSSKAHAFGVTLGVDLNKELAMRGMGGLQDPPAQVLDQVITSGEADRINMQATATLFNPSAMSMLGIGRLNFTLKSRVPRSFNSGANASDFVTMGFVVTQRDDVSLVAGLNSLAVNASIVRDGSAAVNETITQLMENYTTGIPTTLFLTGNNHSTDKTLLLGAFEAMNTSSTLSGLEHLEDKLLLSAHVRLDETAVLGGIHDYVSCPATVPPSDPAYQYQGVAVDCTIAAKNPTGADMLLVAQNFNISWEGDMDQFDMGPTGPTVYSNCNSTDYPFNTKQPYYPGPVGYARNFSINAKVPAYSTISISAKMCALPLVGPDSCCLPPSLPPSMENYRKGWDKGCSGFTGLVQYAKTVLNTDPTGRRAFPMKMTLDGKVTAILGDSTTGFNLHSRYTQSGVVGLANFCESGNFCGLAVATPAPTFTSPCHGEPVKCTCDHKYNSFTDKAVNDFDDLTGRCLRMSSVVNFQGHKTTNLGGANAWIAFTTDGSDPYKNGQPSPTLQFLNSSGAGTNAIFLNATGAGFKNTTYGVLKAISFNGLVGDFSRAYSPVSTLVFRVNATGAASGEAKGGAAVAREAAAAAAAAAAAWGLIEVEVETVAFE